MTPERLEEIETLFHQLVNRPADERTTFLLEICPGNPKLREELEQLLLAHERARKFIESPPAELGASTLAGAGVFAPGQVVDRFKILSVLGKGGMGVVYLAEDTKLHRKVAIKVLPRQFTQDKDRVRRFVQEARAASALNHPNIVTIYDINETEAGYFIVMEFIDGRTLRRIGKEPAPLTSIIEWGKQAAWALAAAHAAGVIHRDIKSDNVMVRDNGFVKILDFGLARLAPDVESESMTETSPNMLIGTAAYMSPEQASGESVSYSTDIFSLGIVLYELVTGKHPFPADSLPARLNAIVSKQPQRPSALNRDIPRALEALLLQMLEKNAQRRPSAVRVAETLISAPFVEAKRRSRRRVAGIAGAVFLLVALCALGWLSFRPDNKSAAKLPHASEIDFISQFGTSSDDQARGLAIAGVNVFVAGDTDGALAGPPLGRPNAFLRNYSSRGEVRWTRQFSTGPHSETRAQDVVATSEGGVYVVISGTEAYLRRFNLAGAEVWTRMLGRQVRAIDVTGFAGDVYVAGQICCYDAWVGRFDALSNQRWIRQFGTTGYDTALATIVREGMVFVAGHVIGGLAGKTGAGGVDAFLRTYDLEGKVIWTRQFGTSGRDIAFSVGADSTGIYVVGSTTGVFPGQTAAGGLDMFINKYNFEGDAVWTRQAGSASDDAVTSVMVEAGNVYVVGNTDGTLPGETSLGETDVFVAKYTSEGDLSRMLQLGSSGIDLATRIKFRKEGVYVVGQTEGTLPGQTKQGGYDAFLLKLRPLERAVESATH